MAMVTIGNISRSQRKGKLTRCQVLAIGEVSCRTPSVLVNGVYSCHSLTSGGEYIHEISIVLDMLR
jgi:hypothetical protein